LWRRVDIELLAGELVDAGGVGGELLLEVSRLRREQRKVDEDAGALDVDQHWDERHLEFAIHGLQTFADDERRQLARQLPGEIRALRGEAADRLR
jgi:hypothetical protein